MPLNQVINIELPPSVAAILDAAGAKGEGGLPHAMSAIIGALPWIGAALFKHVPPDDWALFLGHIEMNLNLTWEILSDPDPPAAFAEALERARAEQRAAQASETARRN